MVVLSYLLRTGHATQKCRRGRIRLISTARAPYVFTPLLSTSWLRVHFLLLHCFLFLLFSSSLARVVVFMSDEILIPQFTHHPALVLLRLFADVRLISICFSFFRAIVIKRF
jgi:hypothetical protein